MGRKVHYRVHKSPILGLIDLLAPAALHSALVYCGTFMATVCVHFQTLPTEIHFLFLMSDAGQVISMQITCTHLSAYFVSICEMKLH
jgi:hypothetical protein